MHESPSGEDNTKCNFSNYRKCNFFLFSYKIIIKLYDEKPKKKRERRQVREQYSYDMLIDKQLVIPPHSLNKFFFLKRRTFKL